MSLKNRIEEKGTFTVLEDGVMKEINPKEDNEKEESAKGEFNLNMNLYEMNKMIIAQLEPLIDIWKYKNEFNDYFVSTGNLYHMLLCHDYRYYTLFSYDGKLKTPQFGDALIEILLNLGNIYSIEKKDDFSYEIWIQPDKEKKEVFAFYLFPYEQGVVAHG